jgi:hypothetical protein
LLQEPLLQEAEWPTNAFEAKVETYFSTASELQAGQAILSLDRKTSCSNRFSQLLHLYSNIGISISNQSGP